ncbi:uncharacterized protein [Coffea arabica]|uniref:Uncharacterized protein isoform X1 n=1 Tax=Coffea arabica TaxID=13443 RepID=A0ABM4UWV2_COFAR
MVKSTTIDAFFKRKIIEDQKHKESDATPSSILSESLVVEPPKKIQRVELEKIDIASLERDPGKRPPIWSYPLNQQDEIRRAYINWGPYQVKHENYPSSGSKKHARHFCSSWFELFPSWLEYSPSIDATFCLSCYLFSKPNGRVELSAFVLGGFKNWKKVNNGDNCAFLRHVGKNPNSFHRIAVKACNDLMNASQHIGTFIEKQSFEQVEINRLRLQVSIDVVRWLAFQGCAFRGRDESEKSLNRGNFHQLIKLLASYNDKVASVVQENAPSNASYTSPEIQKEILYIFSNKVRKEICQEIGNSKFCIIVDEARDESKREQMALVLRYVDKEGCICERFFGVIHVRDTMALTLKEAIFSTLSQHNLAIHNIRGQGYDGASNMRGEWNGLQALICHECPYAYYIHCLAHRLQLALVAASREVASVHQFFSNLVFIINIVTASSKRNDELKEAQAIEIATKIANGELETGRGLNQIGTLKRAGDTRWGSHLDSISSLLKMFNATCVVLSNIAADGGSYSQRGDANFALNQLLSFGFVFTLHLMKDIMEITHHLCMALQRKSQDILNGMHLVSSTTKLLKNFRDSGWNDFLVKVKLFCEQHQIDIPDMNAQYIARRGRSRGHHDEISVEHYYRVDIFIATIDYQLQELHSRFNDHTVELLVLSTALDPRNGFMLFKIDDICKLAEKFYPNDFMEQELVRLRIELQHFELDIPNHPELQELSGIHELCQGLVKTRKSVMYPLIDRLIRLVLTLPVSTATTERAFSIMKIIKTNLRNKMEDNFLNDCLTVYIEKEVAEKFSSDSIIDEFSSMKERRAQFTSKKRC